MVCRRAQRRRTQLRRRDRRRPSTTNVEIEPQDYWDSLLADVEEVRTPSTPKGQATALERHADKLRAYFERYPDGRAELAIYVGTGKNRKRIATEMMPTARVEARKRDQKEAPVPLTAHEGKTYWWFRDKVYATEENLTADDVMALVLEDDNKKRLKLQKAHALMAMTNQLDEKAKRQPIPQDVKVLVWQRDGGRCVECGSNQALEYDHIIPLKMGGSNTDRNLQLLCEVCNRRKGATLG